MRWHTGLDLSNTLQLFQGAANDCCAMLRSHARNREVDGATRTSIRTGNRITRRFYCSTHHVNFRQAGIVFDPNLVRSDIGVDIRYTRHASQ